MTRSLAPRRAVAGLAGLFFIGGGALACQPAQMPTSAPSPLREQTVPAFSRPTLSGSKFDVAQKRGQPIVIKFFANYCEPCKRTLPAAQRLHQRHADVAFVGISEDEYQSQAEAMVHLYGLTFPVVLDRGNVLAGRFRVSEMPVTFVVDEQGVVRWVGGPDQTEKELEQAVRAVASR